MNIVCPALHRQKGTCFDILLCSLLTKLEVLPQSEAGFGLIENTQEQLRPVFGLLRAYPALPVYLFFELGCGTTPLPSAHLPDRERSTFLNFGESLVLSVLESSKAPAAAQPRPSLTPCPPT